MFGKQQFVGKMKGSLSDNYTIIKVIKTLILGIRLG